MYKLYINKKSNNNSNNIVITTKIMKCRNKQKTPLSPRNQHPAPSDIIQWPKAFN